MAYTTINKSTDHFNTKLYTGTGSGNQSVTGVGFQPDWVWTKTRSSTNGHNLYDSVRGVGKYLQSNGSSAESTSATSMVSFDSDGFTVGTGDNVQYGTSTGVSWNWLAGGTASSNTDGSITSSVSANTTAGFSIVSYNSGSSGNATVGHGLGSTPHMIITKSRTSSSFSWVVYHKDIATTVNKYLSINSISATLDNGTSIWGSALSDTNSTTFGIRSGNAVVASTDCIAYCFAEKKGYSKFGSYTGNGSTDGAFIYLGFKPAFLLVKTYTTNGGWQIYDNKRNIGNPTSKFLVPSSNAAEASGSNDIDFLSNGFKTRTTNNPGTTDSFIYMAFAEAPLVGSNNVPCTAR